MTREQAATVKYLDNLWLRNGTGWDRFVMMTRVDADHLYGQVWDFAGNPETPTLHMETVPIELLHLAKI